MIQHWPCRWKQALYFPRKLFDGVGSGVQTTWASDSVWSVKNAFTPWRNDCKLSLKYSVVINFLDWTDHSPVHSTPDCQKLADWTTPDSCTSLWKWLEDVSFYLMVIKAGLFYPLPLALLPVKRKDTMIMAVCHCILYTVFFCQDNNNLDPLLIKLAQMMNCMETAWKLAQLMGSFR